MSAGSVIVDLAAEQGGNCELTQADEMVVAHNVKILGPTNLPSQLSLHASQLYARNVFALLQLLLSEEGINLDFEDQVINETTVTHNGQIHSPVIRGLLGLDG